jgi:predicted Zn-dependent protease
MPANKKGICCFLLLLSGCGTLVSEDPEMVYEQALALVESNKFDEADKKLEQLKSLRPQTTLDHGLKARVLIAKGKSDNAILELSAIPDDHPLGSWARLRKGQLYRQANQFRKAEQELRAVIRIDQMSVEARKELVFILGLQLRRAELNQNFLELSRLTTLNAHEVWVWCMVRDLVWWTPEEQIPLLKKSIEADPEDNWSRLAFAEVLRRSGKTDEALVELKVLENSMPEALAKRLEIELEQDHQETVRELLIKIPDETPSAAIIRGRLSLAEGDAQSAIKYFEIADGADPGRRPVLGDLGRAWRLAGNREKGDYFASLAGRVDMLNNLLLKSETTIHRSGADQWRKLAQACRDAQRLHEARAWLALIIQKSPLDTEAQTTIFQIDQEIQKKSSALK